MLEKYPGLKPNLDAVFCDTIEDDFNKISGAWPEAYFFTDKNGKALWHSVKDINVNPLVAAAQYAANSSKIQA